MYRKTFNKGDAPDLKSPYTVHKGDVTTLFSTKKLKIVSIDPGKKNLAFRVERRASSTSAIFDDDAKVTTLAIWLCKVTDQCTPPPKSISVRAQAGRGNSSSSARARPGRGSAATPLTLPIVPEGDVLLINTIIKSIAELEKAWTGADVIVIERQMPFNYWATRVAQALITFFSIRTNDQCVIIEVDSKLKGSALGAPKTLNEKGLKQWSVEYAIPLLERREDVKTVDYIKLHTKKDDLCDTVCQVEALCVWWRRNVDRD